MNDKQVIVGISGASGAIYGVRLLQILKELPNVKTHLILSATAQITLTTETPYSVDEVKQMADYHHSNKDLAACISSGSFQTDGMVIAPCSMRSLAEIATSMTSGLLTRSADVVLKERRKLVLLTRETPLNLSHIRNMATVTEMGGIIAPPVPAFYSKPESIEEMVDHTVGRVLDMFGIAHDLVRRWQGLKTQK